MCDLFRYRERCCGCSLRTACLAFAILDIILCISIISVLLRVNIELFEILAAIILSIWSIILFFGIYQGRNRSLWLFIAAVVVLSGCAGAIFVGCLIALVDNITTRQTDNGLLSMLLIVYSCCTFLSTLLFIFFHIQIVIIRSYQLKLREQKEKSQYEVPMEQKNVV